MVNWPLPDFHHGRKPFAAGLDCLATSVFDTEKTRYAAVGGLMLRTCG